MNVILSLYKATSFFWKCPFKGSHMTNIVYFLHNISSKLKIYNMIKRRKLQYFFINWTMQYFSNTLKNISFKGALPKKWSGLIEAQNYNHICLKTIKIQSDIFIRSYSPFKNLEGTLRGGWDLNSSISPL